jgi:rubrerythrin
MEGGVILFNSIFDEKLTVLVTNKKKLSTYYNKLSEYIKNRIDREQIKSISEEEEKHINMIQSIYTRMLGGQIISCCAEQIKREQAVKLLGRIIYMETENIKILKSLILSITDPRIKNGLYYILTDDQRHSDIIIYLFTKYS